MTAQTPAPKASGVSALLAARSTVPPPSRQPVKEDFLAAILQALTTQTGSSDNSSQAKAAGKPSSTEPPAPDPTKAALLLAWQTSPFPAAPQLSVPSVPSDSSPAEANSPKEKPPTQEAAASDSSAISLLLALLAAPLPTLPQLPPRKFSAPSVSAVSSAPPTKPAPAQTMTDAKPSAPDATEKPPLATLLTPSPNDPQTKPAPLSGTSVANTTQRMSFTPERNESAARMEQKLPPMAISAIGSEDSGGPSSEGGAKSSLAFSWHDAPSEPLTITDISAVAGSPVAMPVQSALEVPAPAGSATPVERLEQIISREVMTIRQSGAQTLGVSLTLDSSTQLFLQLTSHNGSVQASVRCERGQFAPEDTQWVQLQQSLARQNVALLPMTGGSNLNFQQPSGEHSRQRAAAREDWAAAGAPVQPAQPRKQKEQNRPRRNWESWA